MSDEARRFARQYMSTGRVPRENLYDDRPECAAPLNDPTFRRGPDPQYQADLGERVRMLNAYHPGTVIGDHTHPDYPGWGKLIRWDHDPDNPRWEEHFYNAKRF